MKETVKTSRAIGQLEKMYRQLNNDKFAGQLEEPIITIMDTPRSYGHVTCARVWRAKESTRYELNISAQYLGRPIELLTATLLHEMVHIYHLQHKIQDTSRGATYHNKKFKAKAEEVGLIIDRDEKAGWSITSPSDALIEYICDKGWFDIQLERGGANWIFTGADDKGESGEGEEIESTPSKSKSHTRKYQCPCCGMSVRATKWVNIMCGDCLLTLREVERR